jgi:hypothetical protein
MNKLLRLLAVVASGGWNCPRCGTRVPEGGSCPNPACK